MRCRAAASWALPQALLWMLCLSVSCKRGDPEGIWRRSMAAFPDQDMVQRLMDKYYIEGGKADDVPFKPIPMWTIDPPQSTGGGDGRCELLRDLAGEAQ